ncbi:hypothetical protein PFAS1_05150 [Pseudomonas frederiksbergensis]|uniref:hypothetical protein n=1 Tax=Pseudomonas frederiksbergensis TaxID=104087 RepID=UPI00095817BB|nr:hypothetical protein [Pseudomonas frederiksbergensis]APV38752.1 hypothetical protein PFAS1_05150 [Pseudomonas frederiksbergensis]
MNEPVIKADQSLIINGEFSQALDHWTSGPINPRNLDTGSSEYPEEDSFEISYLIASDEASVSQEFRVPKTLSPDVRYVLSFLHETYNTVPGRLVIEVRRQEVETLELPLNPTHPQVADEDKARQGGGLLEFQPIKTNVDLALTIEENDLVRVSIFSPKKPVDDFPNSRIHVARLRLRVHLPPLQLQEIMLDGEPRLADRPLYLCYGASGSQQHSLAFSPVPGNPWAGTDASWTLENNPQGAIAPTPEWGTNQPLDEDWKLDCPLIEGQESLPLSLILRNQYTAEAYRIEVFLGHHRLDVREVLEPAHYPVLEYQESVRLGVQIISFYTGLPIRDQEVTWTRNGITVDDPVLTDEDGWAFLTYQPRDEDGEHVLKASVASLYYPDGVFTKELIVTVLKTDPWRDLQELVEGSEEPWAEKVGYPNRGSTYSLKLKLPESSPLLGSDFSLRWDGVATAEELGVAVTPALGESVKVTDPEFEWSLACEDVVDGRFDLSLVCSNLLKRSPKKGMSLARNLVKIGELYEVNTSPVVDEQESVLLRIQVLHQSASTPDNPVINALVDWEGGANGPVHTVTGAGGWASFLDTPTSPEHYTITAKVRAHEQMTPITREFSVMPQASSDWKEAATFYLDDVPIDLAVLGVICQRGGTHKFKVTPKAGSPVTGKSMTLAFNGLGADLGLQIGTPVATPEGGREWSISSNAGGSRSGLFEWRLTSEALGQPRALFGRLLSANLADEVSIALDQQQAPIGRDALYPCLGGCHRFSFLPHELSPLVGLQARLEWSGASAEDLGATVYPALDETQRLSDGGAIWWLDFTGSDQDGEFALGLQLPQLAQQTPVNDLVLGHNKLRIETLNAPLVDPVVGEDGAWMWVRVFSAFRPEPVAQVPVTWTAQEQRHTVLTDTDGWSGFEFVPEKDQKYEIEAQVLSRYDAKVSRQTMEVTALASNPWEGLEIAFDGQDYQAWGERTYFPRRNGKHTFNLRAPKGSLLFERQLTLGMTGAGPDELDMRFSMGHPGESRYFSDQGLEYRFDVGDRSDGSFSLRLAAQKLARLSPANAMSQGPGSQVVSFLVNNRADKWLDWGQTLEEQVTVVSSISGRPMVGIQVIWRSPELGERVTQTDFYGVARVRFKPRIPGAVQLTATAGDALFSESVKLPVTLNEPREIEALTSYDSSGVPGQEVSATATVVSAITGEALADVEVMWEYANKTLPPTKTTANGKSSVVFRLSAIAQGTLFATVRGGRAGWDMASLAFPVDATPVVESLVSDRPEIYLGEVLSATAKVVSSEGGIPMEGVAVSWEYPSVELSSSETDEQGLATVSFTPVAIGELRLKATVSSGSAVTLAVRVRDPLESPDHATINRLVAQNPAYVGFTTVLMVYLVSTVSQLPIQGREVFVSVGEKAPVRYITNIHGEAIVNWTPLRVGDFFLGVELKNPGGTSEHAIVVVEVRHKT